jgi:transposase
MAAARVPPVFDPANSQFLRLWKPMHKRENGLFAGHDLGAENWEAIASLIETCKLGGINPNAYLTDVLTRIVTKRDGDTLNDLLPHKWVNTNSDGHMFEYNTMAIAA